MSPSFLKVRRTFWHQLDRNINYSIINAQPCLPAKRSLEELRVPLSSWSGDTKFCAFIAGTINCRNHLDGDLPVLWLHSLFSPSP